MEDFDKQLYLERMNKRYGDPLHHHGDCRIYAAGLPVCTCGLLHDLIIMHEEFLEQHYPSFWEDKVKESLWDNACYDYMDVPVPTLDDPPAMSEEEAHNLMIKGGWRLQKQKPEYGEDYTSASEDDD